MIKFGEILLKILILLAVSFVSFIVGGIVTSLVIDLINWEFITTPSILSDPSFWKIGLIVAPFTVFLNYLIKFCIFKI